MGILEGTRRRLWRVGKYDKIRKTSEIFKEYMKTLLKICRLVYGTVFQENSLQKNELFFLWVTRYSSTF